MASYRLLGVLGGGGMGRVYLGQSRSGRRLAIKMLSPQFAEDPEYRERFAREVVAARLVSPLYTAAVVDADPHAETPWLATTFVEGPSLEQWVEQHGKLSPDKVLGLAAGLAEALGSIHKVGLVHRDVKPSNVIVNPNGPHIIDFGIALSGSDIRITTSLMVGTPAYMAPERVNGLDAGPAGDIYSLGATLYYAATGSQLITSGNFYEQIIQVARGNFDLSAVPGECRSIIELCLEPTPQDRPTPDELMQVLVGIGVSAPETGWWPELEPFSSMPTLIGRGMTRRLMLVGASAVAVAAVGGGVIFSLRGRKTPGREPDFGSPAESPSAATSKPGAPLRLAWQLGITSDARTAGADGTSVRVMVDRGQRLISASGSTLTALDTAQQQVWEKRFTAASGIRLWEWGDAVLVGDLRKLWMVEAASGDQIFAEEVARAEERFTRDNPDRMTVQIERVVTTPELAIVSLGTAMVALDRTCRVVWRVPRQLDDRGRRVALPMTVTANETHVVTWSENRVVLRRTSNGTVVWQQNVPARDNPPMPPRDGGGQDDAWQRLEGRFTGDTILVRDGSLIEARDLSGGGVRWHFTSQTPVASLEVLGDLAVIAADRVVARRMTTGEPVWEAPLRGARLATANNLIVAATDGSLSTLDTGGRPVWQEQFPQTLREGAPDRLTADERHAYVVFRPRPGGPGGPGGGPGGQPGGGASPGAPRPIDVLAFRLD